ncbi:MAG: bifunctional DNA-formamidopyrimidine glycosylase/DNA-(apurinic or apyrimidinic site) lyase [Magnetococcales bacterium]|nr:bifunctional DNA-formamidopyrimidine glycosylase/DNA-(apurinic or apyrimidinic site) lyase [Magnetococcales bacterium]
MPELPEVETIRRGLAPLLSQQEILSVAVRRKDLRWPMPKSELLQALPGQVIREVNRRGKYLLMPIGEGCMIIHLGMSGVLRHLAKDVPFIKHDHFDIAFKNGSHLRLNDPRRFGAVLWTTEDPGKHKLLASLGPEPFTEAFSPEYLFKRSRGRRVAIKNFLMDSHVVVGAGNIYSAESLFLAKINPLRNAGDITRLDCQRLVAAIKNRLTASIEQGGTTLKDFRNEDGKPGYFQQSLNVYGRAGEACLVCAATIEQIRLGGRASAFCPKCQKS